MTNLREKFATLGSRKPVIRLYREEERLPYMNSQIDLSFPEIARTQKFKLDKEADYSLLAAEVLKGRRSSLVKKDTQKIQNVARRNQDFNQRYVSNKLLQDLAKNTNISSDNYFYHKGK